MKIEIYIVNITRIITRQLTYILIEETKRLPLYKSETTAIVSICKKNKRENVNHEEA